MTCSVPYPRWAEMGPVTEVHSYLDRAGVPEEHRQAIGDVLEELFRENARNEEANYEYLCGLIDGLQPEPAPPSFTPATPTLIDSILLGTTVDNQAIAGYAADLFVVANQDDNQTYVVNTADTGALVLEATLNDATNLPRPETAYGVNGSYQLIASGIGASARVATLDVSTPSAPSVQGTYIATSVQAVAALDTTHFVCHNGGSNDRYDVVDWSNPASLTLAGSVADGQSIGTIRQLAVSPDGNYVASAHDTADVLIILDVTDPTNPSIASTTSVTDPGRVCWVNQSTLLIMQATANDTYLYDVSDPTAPSLSSTRSIPRTTGFTGDAHRIDDTYVIIARGESLHVYNTGTDTIEEAANPAGFSTPISVRYVGEGVAVAVDDGGTVSSFTVGSLA